MTSHTYDLLKQLKRVKFTINEYKIVKQTAQKQSMKAIQLWRFKPQIRILFKMAKFQSYLMLFFGFTAIPYILYQKYQQDKQKLIKIAIFTPFAIAACMGPLILYKRFSKKLIEGIIFNLQYKKMHFIKFNNGKMVQAQLKDVSFTLSEKGRIKELLWNNPQNKLSQKHNKNYTHQKFQIQGLGEWESMQLFQFLTKNSQEL